MQQQIFNRTGHLLLHLLVIAFMLALPRYGLGNEKENPILYLNEEGASFTEVLNTISQRTGYEIMLVGDWPDASVSTRLKGVPLETGLKQILGQLGTISHILINDAEDKTIKIVMIRPARDSEKPDHKLFKTDADDSVQADESRPTIESSYAEQQRRKFKLPLDTEIDPPSAQGPGLTIAELIAIKNQYNLQLDEQNDGGSLDPPSEDGNSLTKEELMRIKASHREYLRSVGSDIEISPPSEYGPGMTLGELEKIKLEHANRPMSDDLEIEPPSTYGPGMTAGELAAIKEAYRKKQAFHKQKR